MVILAVIRKGRVNASLLAGVIWLMTPASGSAQDFNQTIRVLSNSTAESLSTAGKKTVAVVDFTDLQENVTELGRFLAEEFGIALVSTGKGFETIDRTHLNPDFRFGCGTLTA